MSELPQNEWIVIFYPQTGIARLCPTLEFAKHQLSEAAALRHIYRNPNDFRARHDHAFLEACWKLAYKNAAWSFPKTATGQLADHSPTPPDCGTEEFCKLFWDMLQDIGDRMVAPTIKVERTKEHYELRLGEMKKLIEDEETYKKTYNNQARTVFEALFNTGRQFLSEEEIKLLILNLVSERRLKTRQKPWVIFQYYRPQFIKDGFVIRGRAPKNRG